MWLVSVNTFKGLGEHWFEIYDSYEEAVKFADEHRKGLEDLEGKIYISEIKDIFMKNEKVK